MKKHTTHSAAPSFKEKLVAWSKSVWFFPAILTLILLVLTVCKISGTSIGIYQIYFNGSAKDSNLVVGRPEAIRSDEWVVNTQMTIAQKNNNYARINHNIGNGQDMSVILDVPYKEWSQVFKPHNLAFFALPFDYAFALKWWIMAYLLILSCYFFILTLMPERKLFAALISIALASSAFIQWWYQYITIGPVYYSLFAATIGVQIMRSKRLRNQLLWGALLAYILVCFVLVLYPPFQIACALAVAAFFVGYLLQRYKGLPGRDFWRRLGIIFGSLVVAGILSLTFFMTRSSVVHTTENTAYPGKRLQKSGGFSLPHLLSGSLDFDLQQQGHAAHYLLPSLGIVNQSEDSNFILLLPFLLVPAAFVLYKDYRRRAKIDWPLLLVTLTFLGALAWLFVPHLDFLGKITLLNRVPHTRLLIGIGLLNILQLVLVVRRLAETPREFWPRKITLGYAALVFLVELALGLHAVHSFPGFIGNYRAVAFALPIPIIMYLLLRKKFVLAALGYAIFAIFTSFYINPLYRSTSIVTDTPLSQAIHNIAAKDPGRWALEVGYLENFPAMNGAHSLSGLYTYPQLSIWAQVDPGNEQYIYNRYAHTNFIFDRDPAENMSTQLVLSGGDHFGIATEPCGAFLRNNSVRFLLTEVPLPNSCTQLVQKVTYPARVFYIYKIAE
ncbi:MAG TPA: hypothetical protein VLG11_03375 [Candidatus Saccharimonadales bacterium]|nr:hypothetical protein [Candidatus Saccharimonadales bacterium]